jgi:hypothetical protein
MDCMGRNETIAFRSKAEKAIRHIIICCAIAILFLLSFLLGIFVAR